MRYEAPSTDDRRIWDLWLTGTYQTAIVAADDAGLFTALGEAPATIDELAGRMDFDVRATGVLLRLLAALDLVLARDARFQLSDQARLYLVKASPFYWGNMMRVGANAAACERLLAKLKDKGSASRPGPEAQSPSQASGEAPVDGWASGKIIPEQARSIAAGMHSHSLPAAIGFARNYDFSDVKRILDVGGGSGCFMVAAAQAHPNLRGTIMDLDTMCEVAKGYIAQGGVADRVDTRPVDMFREPWPEGYDAVFFSNVWHDWSFTTCRWLAEQALRVLPPGGRILLHEMLLDDEGLGPATAAGFSLLMLTNTQGQQFTFGELRSILEAAGFQDVEARHTAGHHSVTTGYKR